VIHILKFSRYSLTCLLGKILTAFLACIVHSAARELAREVHVLIGHGSWHERRTYCGTRYYRIIYMARRRPRDFRHIDCPDTRKDRRFKSQNDTDNATLSNIWRSLSPLSLPYWAYCVNANIIYARHINLSAR